MTTQGKIILRDDDIGIPEGLALIVWPRCALFVRVQLVRDAKVAEGQRTAGISNIRARISGSWALALR